MGVAARPALSLVGGRGLPGAHHSEVGLGLRLGLYRARVRVRARVRPIKSRVAWVWLKSVCH